MSRTSHHHSLSKQQSIAQLQTLYQQHAYEQAIQEAQRFVKKWPQESIGWLILAQSYRLSGCFKQALQAAQQLVQLMPDQGWVYGLIGLLAKQLQDYPVMEQQWRHVLELEPDNGEAYCNLGLALAQLERFQDAEVALKQAVRYQPNLAEAYTNLGVVLQQLGRWSEAEKMHRATVTAYPDYAVGQYNFGNFWGKLGMVEHAIDHYRQALTVQPNYYSALSNYLFTLAYTNYLEPKKLRKEAERGLQHFIDLMPKGTETVYKPHPRAKKQDSLRIGILSGEFGKHPVAHFLLPWLQALDSNQWTIYLYPTKFYDDRFTQLFQALTKHWSPIHLLSDQQATALLRHDRLDILIETSGHTDHNRLGVVAQRVAAVQAHYIGYFATTGLPTMDYFIGDSVLIPPEHDDHFTETVWRLPRNRYAYNPYDTAPEPTWQPDQQGRLWLGSFNNLMKVNQSCLQLWSRVLHALPQASLLLKDRMACVQSVQERILKVLFEEGIDEKRVTFLDYTASWTDHMALYNRLDIALDTLPFNSATTACEALWMGVPLLTLIGNQCAGRQAASLLTGLGRQAWIAQNSDDYVKKAVELAAAVEERKHWRYTQRQEMRNSELCDYTDLANAMQQALLTMLTRSN
jgi:predicted O-linked N-acetylglucosamine transferase (SPINDLY family)